MPLLVRAFPVTGPMEEVHAFAQAMRDAYQDQSAQFYRHYGVSHESWHMQETPNGPMLIAVSVIDDPEEAGRRYANASQEFHQWFKDRVRRLSGVDPDTMPLGPPTTQIFAWSDAERPDALPA